MRERDGDQRHGLTRALGWLSIGLGVPALIAPQRMSRLIGAPDNAVTRRVICAVGLQELTAGAGILRSHEPAGWLWSRVAGDVTHLALLAAAATARNSDPGRLAAAGGVVAGAGVVDVIASRRASQAASTELRVRRTITVNRPPDEVYRRWRDIERLPEFMAHLESVQVLDDRRSRWVAKATGGKTVEWFAEITEDEPPSRIAWRSLDGDVPNSGSVRFTPAEGDRGTVVVVELSYSPRGGRAASVLARLFGEDAAQQVADDLRRFKQVVETGEVVRSDGSPEGSVTRRQLRQRPAQPQP